jgi:hypothetical protein
VSQCGQFSVIALQRFRDEDWINHLPGRQPNVANSACSSIYQHVARTWQTAPAVAYIYINMLQVINHFQEAQQTTKQSEIS